MSTHILNVSIHDFWHCGSGRGEGSHADALVDRDVCGLPYVPGRTLKGLLREALAFLEQQQALPVTTSALLFGHAAQPGATRHDSQPGFLAISDARLPAEVSHWLATPGGAVHRHALFRTIYSTALDDSGVAKDKSLRGIEVAVPLELECEVSGPEGTNWSEFLQQAFPLVRAVGGHRQRGLGRCTLAWRKVS